MIETRTTSTPRSTATPAASLVAGALIVPLVFWIGVDESFVVPKLIAVVGVTVVAIAQLARAADDIEWSPWRRVDLAVLAWIGLVTLSLLTSVDRAQSWWGEIYQRQGYATALLYAAGYALARLTLTDTDRIRLVMRSIAVAATGIAAYAVVQRIGLDPIWDDIPADRVFATIGQTNSLGAFLVLAIPLSLGLSFTARRHRLVYAAAAGLQTVALALTLSRGGFVGLFVAGVMLTVFGLGQRGWQWQGAAALITTATLAVLVIVAIMPGLESTAGRVIDRAFAEEEWTTGSIRNHVDLWIVAANVIADNPVVGTGPDTFPEVFGDYRDDVLADEGAARLRPFRVESPHNIVLATATGSGVPAALAQLVATVGAAALAVRRGWATRRGREATLWFATGSAVAGALVASLFITADLTTTWLMWVLMGAVAAGPAMPEQDACEHANLKA
jgi:O-antigen ligase